MKILIINASNVCIIVLLYSTIAKQNVWETVSNETEFILPLIFWLPPKNIVVHSNSSLTYGIRRKHLPNSDSIFDQHGIFNVLFLQSVEDRPGHY